MKSTFRN